MDDIINLFVFLLFGGCVTIMSLLIFAISLEKFTSKDEDGNHKKN